MDWNPVNGFQDRNSQVAQVEHFANSFYGSQERFLVLKIRQFVRRIQILGIHSVDSTLRHKHSMTEFQAKKLKKCSKSNSSGATECVTTLYDGVRKLNEKNKFRNLEILSKFSTLLALP